MVRALGPLVIPGTYLTNVQLKMLNTPYQADFLAAPDIAWFYEGQKAGTVRTVGPGASGTLAYLTIDDSGHSLVSDQPAYARWIVDKWIDGEAFA